MVLWLMCVPLSLYAVAAWPQLWTNYKRGSASGLSHWMLYLRVSAVAYYTVYVFLCQLPLPHKILYPICLTSMALLALQTYRYDALRSKQRLLVYAYIKFFHIIGGLLIMGHWHPVFAGMLAGWLAVGYGLLSDMPQIVRNWRRKSTAGFNILFATAIGCGGLFDLTLSIMHRLPLPTLLATGRVSLAFAIYLFQFFIYR